MKRYGNLYAKICSKENLKLAYKHAKKGKGWYAEVKAIEKDLDHYIDELHEMLVNHQFHTSEYVTFTKKEGKKEREIYKLPFYPDRIVQWAVLQVIEPQLLSFFTDDTYSAIPNKGIHAAFKKLRKDVDEHPDEMLFCCKIDCRKFYPSIDHEILKAKYRRKYKDGELLDLIDEIIESISTCPATDENIEFYLSEFDHWMKEVKHIKFYYRYMDDICIFGKTKEELHQVLADVQEYLKDNLNLRLKDNYQIFPSFVRGVDFVGYRIFKDFTLLRKTTCLQMEKKMTKLLNKVQSGQQMNYSEWCSINSYKGWLIHCDSYRLSQKYIAPVQKYADAYYEFNIKNKKGGKVT